MKAPTIDEYIAGRVAALTAEDERHIPHLLTGCREKEGQVPTARHPRLAGQIGVIRQVLRQCPRPRPAILPTRSWSELLVGASYVAKGVDFIPDQVPDLGYADDASLLDRIFVRNREEIQRACAQLEISAPPETIFP